jgi:hypothetical protein
MGWWRGFNMAGTIFNFGRDNHLGWVWVVDDNDYDRVIAWWLSGRIFGRYISVPVRFRKRLR